MLVLVQYLIQVYLFQFLLLFSQICNKFLISSSVKLPNILYSIIINNDILKSIDFKISLLIIKMSCSINIIDYIIVNVKLMANYEILLSLAIFCFVVFILTFICFIHEFIRETENIS